MALTNVGGPILPVGAAWTPKKEEDPVLSSRAGCPPSPVLRHQRSWGYRYWGLDGWLFWFSCLWTWIELYYWVLWFPSSQITGCRTPWPPYPYELLPIINLPLSLSVCRNIYPCTICPSIRVYIYMSMSVYLSIYTSIYLFFYQSSILLVLFFWRTANNIHGICALKKHAFYLRRQIANKQN